jgi:HSP20 family protein
MARELTRMDPSRFDPFDDLRNMRRVLDRFMGGTFPLVAREDVEFGGLEEPLPVDVFERGNEVIVKAALPGVDPKDVDIRVTDGILHIRAETKDEQDVQTENYHRHEYRYGRFARSFRLPPNLDTTKAEAKYDNGMLRLSFPKTEESRERSMRIEVKQEGKQLTGNQPERRQAEGKQPEGKQPEGKQQVK